MSALIASLGMYAFPSLAAANAQIWPAMALRLAGQGLASPPGLTSRTDLEALWENPNLLFAQTCGYPFIRTLRGRVALVATPIYDFPGCRGADHCSFLVARASDAREGIQAFRGARAVLNGPTSNSGMNLFRATIAPIAEGRPFFSHVAISGSHLESLEAVTEGRADLAALDCVSFGLLRRARPDLADAARIVAQSPPSPGLPFVASVALAPAWRAPLRAALVETLADPAVETARRALGLVGAQVLSEETYDRVAALERAAADAGYPILA